MSCLLMADARALRLPQDCQGQLPLGGLPTDLGLLGV